MLVAINSLIRNRKTTPRTKLLPVELLGIDHGNPGDEEAKTMPISPDVGILRKEIPGAGFAGMAGSQVRVRALFGVC